MFKTFEGNLQKTNSELNEAASVVKVKDLETDFYKQVGALPSELAKKWIDEYDNLENLENSDFFLKFKGFLQARKHALVTSVNVESGVKEEVLEEIGKAQTVINQTFGNPDYFINNGSTAEVYVFPIAPHICVKYISSQENYNEHNHLRTEYNFLRQLKGLHVGRVRTPVPYFLQIHPSSGHSYGMEKVVGKSLSQILEKPGENIDLIQVIRGLNKDEVKNELIQYIKEMHTRFRITHNDLEFRNMMVDKNGQFFIIDFGKAKYEEIGEDHESFRISDLTKISTRIDEFFKRVDGIKIDDIIAEEK